MLIWFENEYGKFEMGGSGHPVANITAIAGLGIPPLNREAVRYPYSAGQTVLAETDLPRTITIGGTIYGGAYIVSQINRILYAKGTLYFAFDDGRQRRIDCRCTSLPDPERQGRELYEFAVQFVCDHPYFKDAENTVIPTYLRIDLIATTFVLPCVFTERIVNSVIKLSGDRPVNPIFHIRNKKVDDTPSSEYGMLIENLSTGKFLKLDYDIQENEIITVDIDKLTVISNKNGSIINAISDDTILSDFTLAVGENNLKFTNLNSANDIEALIEFSPLYVEAVL